MNAMAMADPKVIAIARARGAKAEREKIAGRVDDLEDVMRMMADTNERIVQIVGELRVVCADIITKINRIDTKLNRFS